MDNRLKVEPLANKIAGSIQGGKGMMHGEVAAGLKTVRVLIGDVIPKTASKPHLADAKRFSRCP